MNAIITLLCTVSGALFSFIFSYAAFLRGHRKDNRKEGEDRGVLLSDIGYIKSGVDDLKRESRENKASISALAERVTRCEAAGIEAHHRLERLEANQN